MPSLVSDLESGTRRRVHGLRTGARRLIVAVDDQALRTEIERFNHTLNATWIGADRSPIIETHFDSVEPDITLAIMRLAEIFMFAPTRAGMGAPAKEFSVLSQTGGVLILSDRCGAAAELGHYSVLVDRTAPDSIVDALKQATTLDAASRHRLAALRSEQVRGWTTTDRADRYLQQLAEVGPVQPSLPQSATPVSRSRSEPTSTAIPSGSNPERNKLPHHGRQLTGDDANSPFRTTP